MSDSWLGESETQLCSNLNVLMTNECLEPIYGQDGEECYLLPVSPLITLNSTSAQSRLRCSAFVIGHDCLLSNMERWLHSAIWRNSSWEMYLSKLARAELINLDLPHSEVPQSHSPTLTMVGCWMMPRVAKQSTRCNEENVSQSAGERKIPACLGHQSYQGGIMMGPDWAHIDTAPGSHLSSPASFH